MIAPTIALLVAGVLLTEPASAQEANHPASSVNGQRLEPAEDAKTGAVAHRDVRTPTQEIDVRIYGGSPLVPQGKYPATEHPYTPPKPVPASAAVQGSSLLIEGAAARAAAKREKATTLSSAAAGASVLASNLTPSKGPSFEPDPAFNSSDFLNKAVDFSLDLADEKFMLEARSEVEARHRLRILQERQHNSTFWQQNSQLIKSAAFVVVVVALLVWWWSGLGPRATRWAVRAVILVASFYIHWAFGLFMLFGLYTYLTKSHRR